MQKRRHTHGNLVHLVSLNTLGASLLRSVATLQFIRGCLYVCLYLLYTNKSKRGNNNEGSDEKYTKCLRFDIAHAVLNH